MRKAISVAMTLGLGLCTLSSYARDSVEGNRVVVKPYKDGTFTTGEYRFGKAELFGYVGDLKDSKKLSGILLRDGGKATTEQKHMIAEIAKAQALEAVIELDGKQQPLVDPTPVAAPATSAPAPEAAPAVEAGAAASAGGH